MKIKLKKTVVELPYDEYHVSDNGKLKWAVARSDSRAVYGVFAHKSYAESYRQTLMYPNHYEVREVYED